MIARTSRCSTGSRNCADSEAVQDGSRDMHPLGTIVSLDGIKIGGPQIVIMAGRARWRHASRSSRRRSVKEAGAQVLRGGAFKPRSSPIVFRGSAKKGWSYWLKRAHHWPASRYRSHVAGTSAARDSLRRYAADRRAQHAELRAAASRGQGESPVLLKRHDVTVEELLMSANTFFPMAIRVCAVRAGIRL